MIVVYEPVDHCTTPGCCELACYEGLCAGCAGRAAAREIVEAVFGQEASR